MRTVARSSLRTGRRRYVAAALAVAVSVAFVIVVGVLTAGAMAGIMATDGAPYRGADLVVDADPDAPPRGPACCPATLNTGDALALVARLGDAASGLGTVRLPVAADGTTDPGTFGPGTETSIGPVASTPELRWQKLVTGRFPTGPGEVVLHVWDARSWGVTVGDRVRAGDGADATGLAVVGLVESPSTWAQASMYVTWPQYLHWRDHPTFHVGSIAVRGELGPAPAGTLVWPAQDYVRNGLTGLNNGTDAVGLMLLLFTAVSVVVAVLVVANTFSILFAGRLREFALLRCVGATRRQVLGSVRLEAVAVGVLASLAGTVVGAGAGYGLLPLVNLLSAGAPMVVPAPPAGWLVGGFALGVLVTLVASWLPTRQVVRVDPLAALRPAAGDTSAGGGRARAALAVLLLVAGPSVLAAAVVAQSTELMLAGGVATFGGVLLAGPVVVPRLVRAVGAAFGPAARVATANAVRHPRRTATTTAALLVGVTLTTAVLTGTATWSAAMEAHRAVRLPVDVTLTALDRPLPTDLADQVRGTPGVAQAAVVAGAVARISGWDGPVPVLAAPDAGQVARDGGAFARAEPGTVVLDRDAFRSPDTELGVRPGDPVTVRVGDRQVELRAVLLGGWGRAAMVAPQTLAQLTGSPAPHEIWVRADDNADPLRLVGDLDTLAGGAGAELSDRLQARAAGDRQLDVLTWSALGLAGISLAIGVAGIGNTLSLSTLERVREHALLRALGLTRRGLRRLLATEAVLLSVVATVLGTGIGLGFAWVAYAAVVRRILDEATMVVPWPSLGVVAVVSALTGLVAAVLPARRAARVAPAAGLALD